MDILRLLKSKKDTINWSYRINDKRQLEKYKSIWTKVEYLKNIKLNALPVYNNRYVKAKIRTFGDKVCIDFRGLYVPEDDIKCESFTIISIDSLPAYEKKSASIFRSVQVYLDK